MAKHIFIDNSNLFIGAKRAVHEVEYVPKELVRVNYHKFFKIIEGDDICETRILVASVPTHNKELWGPAGKGKYKVMLPARVDIEGNGKHVEQGVDEILHAAISDTLLDHISDGPQTLVLVTGDGNPSKFGTSFEKRLSRRSNIDGRFNFGHEKNNCLRSFENSVRIQKI